MVTSGSLNTDWAPSLTLTVSRCESMTSDSQTVDNHWRLSVYDGRHQQEERREEEKERIGGLDVLMSRQQSETTTLICPVACHCNHNAINHITPHHITSHSHTSQPWRMTQSRRLSQLHQGRSQVECRLLLPLLLLHFCPLQTWTSTVYPLIYPGQLVRSAQVQAQAQEYGRANVNHPLQNLSSLTTLPSPQHHLRSTNIITSYILMQATTPSHPSSPVACEAVTWRGHATHRMSATTLAT